MAVTQPTVSDLAGWETDTSKARKLLRQVRTYTGSLGWERGDIEALKHTVENADEAEDAQTERRELGRLIYLAMYQHQGAIWEANETQDVWFAVADRFIALLNTRASGAAGEE